MDFNVEPYLVALLILSAVFAIIDLAHFSKIRRARYLEELKDVADVSGVQPLPRKKRFTRSLRRFILGQLDSYPEIDNALVGVSELVLEKYRTLLRPNFLFDYSRSLFPVFLIVVVIRSFIFEPYLVPTGSLEPTVLPGDFLLVSKFSYGLRVPLTRHTFYHVNEPERGDIVVFRYPPNPSINYVKRVVGVPGDHVSYISKVLYINGKEAKQREISTKREPLVYSSVKEYSEDLAGVTHDILINRYDQSFDFKNVVVPEGYYFMMGDNRDNSLDSRFWGFVPEKDLVGKADLIWLSKTPGKWDIRWSRMGTRLDK